MYIILFIEIRFQFECFGSGADKADSRISRFLHHLTQIACHFELAFPGHAVHFYRKCGAAHSCPCQTTYNANLRLAVNGFGHEFSCPQNIFQILRRNSHGFLFAGQDRRNCLTANFANHSFQLTYACFSGIAVDDGVNGIGFEFQLFCCQTVAFSLFAHQMVFCNMQFFIGSIAGKLDDFHSVSQRAGDGFQTVCGTHEQHLGQVIRLFHEMVAEGMVLFRVKNLQQSCRRVAIMRNTQFIHFIQEHQRIDGTYHLHSIDDSAGHSTDIGSSVTADFRFILHAAQRHSHIFSVQCLCDGTGNGCFTYTGRAHQTKDGCCFIGCIFADSKVFQNTFLHLFHAVMIFIQNFGSLRQVKQFFCCFCPGQRKHRFNIRSGNVGFRRCYRNFQHTVDFFFHHFFYMLRRILFLQLLAVFRRIGTDTILIAQLILNYLQFFPQIIFSLILVDLLFCFFFDFSLDIQHLTFLLHHCDDCLQSFEGIQDIQKFLLTVIRQFQTCRHHVRQLTGFCSRNYVAHQIHSRCVGRQFQVIIIFFHGNFHDRLYMFGRFFLKILGNGCDFAIIAVSHMNIQESAAGFAFHDDMSQITWQFQYLLDFRQNADIIQIISGRIHRCRIFLSHQKDFFPIFFRCLQGIQRFLPSGRKTDGHAGEYGQTTQGDHRHDDRLFLLHFLHLIYKHYVIFAYKQGRNLALNI